MIKTILSGNMTADPILNTRNIGGDQGGQLHRGGE